MSAPYHMLEELLEDAAAAVLKPVTDALTGFSVKKGGDFSTSEPPFVAIAAPRSAEDVPDTGGLDVELVVAVVTTSATSRADHGAAVAKVSDVLYDATLPALLTAAASRIAVQLITRGTRERSVAGNVRKTAISLTVQARAI